MVFNFFKVTDVWGLHLVFLETLFMSLDVP